MGTRRLHRPTRTHRSAGAPELPALLTQAVAVLNLPALVVSPDGRVHRVNAAAERLAARGLPMSWRSGRLAVSDRAADARLRAALRGVGRASSQAVVLLRRPGRGPVICRVVHPVVPLLGRSMRKVLHLIDPEQTQPPAAAVVARHFDLTPRQAAVARGVAMGRRLPQLAAEWDVEISTVRSHLKAAMIRMGCRTQAEVARAVLALGAPMHPAATGWPACE